MSVKLCFYKKIRTKMYLCYIVYKAENLVEPYMNLSQHKFNVPYYWLIYLIMVCIGWDVLYDMQILDMSNICQLY